MRQVLRWMVFLLLLVLIVGGIHPVQAQVPPELINPKKATSTVCDLKTAKKFTKCSGCSMVLIGYKCQECIKGCEKCKGMFTLEEAQKNGFKCPCCGSKKILLGQLVKNNMCFLCDKPLDNPKEMVEMCIKNVYTCPVHKTPLLKPGKCREDFIDPNTNKKKKCGRKLELSEIDIAEVVTQYECPKCKAKLEEPGKCLACKKTMKKVKCCKMSGTFPHVNEKTWEKAQKEALKKK